MSGICVFLITATLSASPENADVSEKQVRETVQRSIGYIQERGVWWIEKKDCVSCHRVGMMVWSLSTAKRRGFSVDKRLEEWLDWSLDQSTSLNDKGKVVGAGNREGVAQLLLARTVTKSNKQRDKHFLDLTNIIAADQLENGTWQPGGQLPSQKRPKAETADVSTMWLTLALADETSSSIAKIVELARQRIAKSQAGKSTEWYVMQLLLANRFHDAPARQRAVDQLLAQQRDDGGWGWIVGEKSDALGTGMALYGLLLASKIDQNQTAISNAKRFLVNTQSDDGTWPVHGTKSKKKESVQETSKYWGATWAVLALCQSLVEPSR